MGVTITDTITLDNGLTVDNAYASFGNQDMLVQKRTNQTTNASGVVQTETKYHLMGQLNFWATKALRDQNKNTIKTEYISATLTLTQLDSMSTNLYKYIYDNVVKTKYNTSDSI